MATGATGAMIAAARRRSRLAWREESGGGAHAEFTSCEVVDNGKVVECSSRSRCDHVLARSTGLRWDGGAGEDETGDARDTAMGREVGGVEAGPAPEGHR